jgi:hypothetical protein
MFYRPPVPDCVAIMRNHRRSILFTCLFIGCLFAGCTLKLTTDLSKIIGTDNPKELMGSSEAQQIATRIGEGMGTKIMEGEILAEDMGKGLGKVFLKSVPVPIIEDPVSVELIETSGIDAMKTGRWDEAMEAFKRTGNRARLEEIALILFDQGRTLDAADLHQYLIDRGWPIRAPYLASRRIEMSGLAIISNARLKEIDPGRYNLRYAAESHTILDTVALNEAFVKNNTLRKEEMLGRLKTAPVIILADAYFDPGQHGVFLEVISALADNEPVVGLEEQLLLLKSDKAAAAQLNYLPILAFIEEKGLETFTHGNAGATAGDGVAGTIDFFGWDSSLADVVAGLLRRGRQVVLITGITHASTDHLPFLIEERTGIDPVLVVQSPLGLTVQQLFEKHAAMCSRLAAWGADEGSAIAIANDYYICTPLSSDDLEVYLGLFDLQPLLSPF